MSAHQAWLDSMNARRREVAVHQMNAVANLANIKRRPMTLTYEPHPVYRFDGVERPFTLVEALEFLEGPESS